jgi:ribosomal protein S18 acetylase RimI-like enzyme
MNNIPTYRLLSLEDIEAFRALRLRGLKECPDAFLDDYEEWANEPVESFRKFFDGWVAGAFFEGKLLGISGLYREKGKKLKHKGTIWGVYVAPEARGKGLGRGLLTLLLDEAKKSGLELVQLSADETSLITLRLYQSIGFSEYGRDKHIMKVGDHYVTDVLMAKFL